MLFQIMRLKSYWFSKNVFSDIPTCFPNELCTWNKAVFSSRSFLGDSPDYLQEAWILQTESPKFISLYFDNFDIGCNGRSELEIEYTAENKVTHCNKNRPIGHIMSTFTKLTISFRYNQEGDTLTEYFSAIYNTMSRNQSLTLPSIVEDNGKLHDTT